MGRKILPPGAGGPVCLQIKADGVGFVEIGTGDDAFPTAARTLNESPGFTKILVAVYLKKI